MGTFSKKNIKRTQQRNGRPIGNTTVIKYINQIGMDGMDGQDSFNIIVSPNAHIFEAGPAYALDNQFDRVHVFGFRGSKQIDVSIGELVGLIPGCLDASIYNNGTNNTYIDFRVTSLLSQGSGQVEIPVRYNLEATDSSIAVDASIWDSSYGYTFGTATGIYSWALAKSGGTGYTFDLSNENASINCDSSGNILAGAVRPTCTATLSKDGVPVEDAEYSIVYSPGQNVTGVSINASTGVMTFSQDFSFDGYGLEITVIGSIGTMNYGSKVMTITKNYPGADGSPAVSYWLKVSADAVQVNPNLTTPTAVPSSITATAYKQIGEETPVQATGSGVVIKYSYDQSTATTTYTGPISVDISKTYLRIELYVDSVWRDGETIQIIYAGQNGTNGASKYLLDLTNENAGINCDSSGNILAGALRPTCTATLFYGDDEVTDASYGISYPNNQSVQGVSINSSTGVLTFNSGSAGTPFSFTGDSLEITVNGYDGNELCASRIMSILKNFPGADGSPAVTYFLKLSTTQVKVDPNNGNVATPSTVTAEALKQVGEQNPVAESNAVIKYGYNTVSPTAIYQSAITVDATKDYITFELYYDNVWRDEQTVDILSNGLNGQSVYRLDLSNENASINCDASGNILHNAIRPTCTATLYYGTSEVYSAVYSIEYPDDQYVQGVSINSSSGVLTFNPYSATYPFSFTGTSLEVTVYASVNSTVVATDIMTITKAYPGIDGSPAVSYFLKLSADKIKVDPNNSNTATPSTITAEALKQVGDENPVTATGAVIKYGYNTVSPTATYSSAITVDTSKDYITFELYYDDVWRDEETVPILYEGTNGTNGDNVYRLDLTNENASINCDSAGNILGGATRPTCTANLFYGTTDVPNVTYEISTPSSQNVTGLSIDSTSGVLTFKSGTASNPFSFTGSSLEITVTATVNNTVCGTAIMTVTKSYPGNDGSPAVSYWLTLSANEIKKDPNNNNTCTPSTITASAYKQVGDSTPETATDTTIKYGYNTASPSTTYSSAITVDKTKDYITFNLILTGTSVVLDTETVPILSEGKDGSTGSQGPQGLKGASIRGPVNWWDQTVSRRFCNGVYSASHPEDALWIDLIYKDNSYYYCNNSYTGSCQDSWTDVSVNWTGADQEFEFIATKLLLAQNAVINFLNTNQLTLMNDAGTAVVGGAMGGSGINFWAGGTTPGTAPFRVSYDGTIHATKGIFSGYVQMPYTFMSSLTFTSGQGYTADERAYLINEGRSYGSGGLYDGNVLILPEPSASYNGFTYHIISLPQIATKASGSLHTITLRTTNNSEKLKVFTYTNIVYSFDKLAFYGGHIEVTCIPLHDSWSNVYYYWAVTQCTGGVDCYQNGSLIEAHSTVCGLSYESELNTINSIITDNTVPSVKQNDAIYIPRT